MAKATQTPRAALTTADRKKLSAETLYDDGTVSRWATGARVRDSTAIRLAQAARKYGIEVRR